jgi:hypothetical protein
MGCSLDTPISNFQVVMTHGNYEELSYRNRPLFPPFTRRCFAYFLTAVFWLFCSPHRIPGA